MTYRLKDPKKHHPRVRELLAGTTDGAKAGRWLAGLIRETVKDCQEGVYHNMATWAIKDGVAFANVPVYRTHASLGVSHRVDDPDGLFARGKGKVYRSVRITAPDAIPKAKLVRMIKQAAALARAETEETA